MNKKIFAKAAAFLIAAQMTVFAEGVSLSLGFDAESGKISLRGSADGEVFIPLTGKNGNFAKATFFSFKAIYPMQ